MRDVVQDGVQIGLFLHQRPLDLLDGGDITIDALENYLAVRHVDDAE